MRGSYSDESVIKLRPLVKRRYGKRYIIGNEESEIYVSITPVAYEILKLFEKGLSVKEIKLIVNKRFGNINIDYFVRNLLKHDFVESIDGKEIKPIPSKKGGLSFDFIPKKFVDILFSKWAYIIYLLVLISSFFILILEPKYLPRYSDYFFIDNISLLFILSFLFGWVLVFIHELAHYLAARSLGIRAKIYFSNRLYFLVAVTDITNIYKVSRKKRYRVYLAGMTVDLLIMSVLTILLFLSDLGYIHLQSGIYSFFKFLVLLEFLGIIWQFYFFLRTDIYYVVENFFNVTNLSKKAQSYLFNLVLSLSKKHSKKHHHFRIHFSSKTERRVVKFYSLFYGLGILISLFVFLFYQFPIALKLILIALGNMLKGVLTGNKFLFYDSLIFMFIWLFNQLLLIYIIIKKYKIYQKPIFYIMGILALLLTNYFIVLLTTIVIILNLTSRGLINTFLFLLGFFFGLAILSWIEALNKLQKLIIIELFLPAVTLIVSVLLLDFTVFFLEKLKVITPITNSLPITIFLYTCGMVLSYLIFLPTGIHNNLYKSRVKMRVKRSKK